MKKTTLILLFCFSLFANAQSKVYTKDKNYLEDQLYIGVTYNLLTNKPNSINLRGFSNTMLIGYIRDIPFNKKNNKGIGIGLGYSNNTYFHNIKIVSENNQATFGYFKNTDEYDSNKLVFHSIDVPFEVRFRNSTLKKSKFWRFYFGMKLSYIFYNKSQFNLFGETKKYANIANFNKIQYGLTSSIGHGTWNGYFYYGLTDLFDNAIFNESENLNLKSVRFGLIFYIL